MNAVAQTPERYQFIEPIAVGGMAEVFLAKASGVHGFEKAVAIKRILPKLARSADFESRFVREAQVAAALSHSNIVQVFDFGRFEGSLFIAMEYVDGPDLRLLLKAAAHKGVRPPLPAMLQIALGVTQGLDFAHRHGVVHRDVSVSNVLISLSGDVKVADFGIALFGEGGAGAESGMLVGKVPYMSPEQARSETLDARSDVFSLGAVLFELFTGQRLFDGGDEKQVMQKVLSMPIPAASSIDPTLPRELDAVLLKLLERDPDLRPKNGGEVLKLLREFAHAKAVVCTPLDVAELVSRVLPKGEALALNPLEEGVLQLLGKGRSSKEATNVVQAFRHRTLSLSADEPTAVGLTLVRGAAKPDGVTSFQTLRPSGAGDHVPLGAVGSTDATEAVPSLEHGPTAATPWRTDVKPAPASARRSNSVAPALSDEDTQAAPATVPRPKWRWAAAAVVLLMVGFAAALYSRSAARSEASARPDLFTPQGTSTGTVALESLPAGAAIAVDGKPMGLRTPAELSLSASDAPHRIELSLVGHRSWSDEVVVREQVHVVYRPTLEPLPFRFRVTSQPAGAAVSVDGVPRGVTPLSVEEPSRGQPKVVTLKREGYQTVERTVPLPQTDDVSTLEVKLEPLAATAGPVRYGRIDLFVEPWATVYLGDQKLGNAPIKGLKLPVGRHRLKLVNPVQQRQTFIDVAVPSKAPYRVTLP